MYHIINFYNIIKYLNFQKNILTFFIILLMSVYVKFNIYNYI